MDKCRNPECDNPAGIDVTLTVGSLFAGIGGFDRGLERAGFKIKWQVEIDPWCQKILEKHWPTVRRWDDVRTWPQPDTERVDVIVGGFPCQDISVANPNGKGLAGKRSGLWTEFHRIIRRLRPNHVIVENVPALLERGIGRVLGDLAEIGYDAEWDCIPAAAVGSDQIRNRIFIYAYPEHGRVPKRRGIDPACKKMLYRSGVCESKSQGGKFQTDAALEGFARNQTQWQGKPGVDRVANGIPNRVDRLRGLGNAIVPQIAEWIGRRLIESINATNAEAAKDRQRILDESNDGYSELRAKGGE
jgi:DNA (cytosine-5)-methyltransferase 1